MTREKRVPIIRAPLNNTLKAAVDAASNSVYWNTRGRPNMMLIEDLQDIFKEHAKREGNGWDKPDTREALHKVMKNN